MADGVASSARRVPSREEVLYSLVHGQGFDQACLRRTLRMLGSSTPNSLSVADMRTRLSTVLGSMCKTDEGLRALLNGLELMGSALTERLRTAMEDAGYT